MRATAICTRLSPALVVSASAVSLLAAPLAHAADSGRAPGAPDALTLDLRGHVASHCGFQTPPPKSVDFGDLTVAGSASAAFTLNCNAPFRLRISSANGAMALQNPPQAAPVGFDQSDPYQLAVSFATDLGAVSSGACDSSDLKTSSGRCPCYGAGPGQGLSSGDGVSIGKDGAVSLSWSAPRTKLVAGAYADTITIVVEVRS